MAILLSRSTRRVRLGAGRSSRRRDISSSRTPAPLFGLLNSLFFYFFDSAIKLRGLLSVEQKATLKRCQHEEFLILPQ